MLLEMIQPMFVALVGRVDFCSDATRANERCDNKKRWSEEKQLMRRLGLVDISSVKGEIVTF